MVDTFTCNQLVRFIYKECCPTETMLIEECCIDSWEMKEEITMLHEAKQSLPKVLFSAHPDSLANILHYSLKTA